MIILNDKQINQKVKRLAFEIIEQNTDDRVIYLAGINNNGFAFASLLKKELDIIKENKTKFELINISLNPANPTDSEISINVENKLLKNKSIIIVDDVANTGRTIFYACLPFMNIILKKLRIAVLIDRMHKSFPIKVEYTGLSLATTLNENIVVNLQSKSNFSVTVQ